MVNWTTYVINVKENDQYIKVNPKDTLDPILKANEIPKELVIFTRDNEFKKLNYDQNIWGDLAIKFGDLPGRMSDHQ